MVDAPHGPRISDTRIVFYDGYCVLCSRSVDFVISRDPTGRFRFASLQSNTATRLLPALNYPLERITSLDNIVYLRDGVVKIRSDAVLSILWDLGGAYRAGRLAYCIPRFIRDLAYDHFARRRYRWFGQRDTCRVPTQEEASRILE